MMPSDPSPSAANGPQNDPQNAPQHEPLLHAHRSGGLGHDDPNGNDPHDDEDWDDYDLDNPERQPSALPRYVSIGLIALVIVLVIVFFGARLWARHAMQQSLPQIDGALSIPGLAAPVTVLRDAHGVPHIRATSLDDLVFSQGYVTAQDRLWQMEALRRHATGNLAEILGARLVSHDRTQRTLQIGLAADRAIAVLPPEQLHWLEQYARGVNASIADQSGHLPIEFRVLGFTPAPWTPRDSILLSLIMFQDLSTRFPAKLSHELLGTRLPPALLDDLYPVGSWRDHPPTQPIADLTNPEKDFEPIPLDDSQTKLQRQPGATQTASAPFMRSHRMSGVDTAQAAAGIEALRPSLTALNAGPSCEDCASGSNNWVVSGAHTANGKPLLANDMHLTFSAPGLWYETDLEAPGPTGADFHVTGVALPGAPFIIVGHNDHVAWGFTNLGADVQDLYVERTRVVATSSGSQTQFLASDGTWKPVVYRRDTIHVRNGKDVPLELASTEHGGLPTPIVSSLFSPSNADDGSSAGLFPLDKRTIALRWTIYDPANVTDPFFAVNSAADGTSLVAAFSTWGGPSQNLVYADDQGHIGYHALGRIPVRGSLAAPTPLRFAPVAGVDPSYDWAGYIPYEQLPQVVDPPSGVIATANARVTPDNYPYPLSLDWEDPYRNERIWKVLLTSKNLKPADSLRLQADIYSEADRTIAQRLAYAIDHCSNHNSADKSPRIGDEKRLRLAADILRNWNGSVDASSAAPAIVDAARLALWPMLLTPKLGDPRLWELYTWGEKAYAEEQIILHAPARWLPKPYATWNSLLAAAVERGLTEEKAPANLGKWTYGSVHTVNIEHPLFSLSPLIPAVIGLPTGTGPQPLSGDGTTVRQSRNGLGPSERFTADLGDLDQSTLNIVLGQSGNPASPWYLDQWPAWYKATTFPLPYSAGAVQRATAHTLTLNPK